MKIFLHIGMAKTGTTSIQRFCMENRHQLAAQGIYYPLAPMNPYGNHTMLAAYSHDNDRVTPLKIEFGVSTTQQIQEFRRDLLRNMAFEFDRNKPQSVFMSNEHLSLMPNRREVERLRNLLHAFSDDITVIVYLRKQIDQHVALHTTRVVRGESKYELELDSDIREHPFYDYIGCLDTWADYFGKDNIIVRPFEREQLKDGDVVKDCLDILNVEGKFNFSRERNKRPSIECIQFLELMNEHLPRFEGDSRGPYHREIGDLVKSFTGGTPYKAPGISKFQTLFNEQNAEIARKYLDRDDGRLFKKDAEKAAPDLLDDELTTEKAVEIASQLWMEQCKTIDTLGVQLMAYKTLLDSVEEASRTVAEKTAAPQARPAPAKKPRPATSASGR